MTSLAENTLIFGPSGSGKTRLLYSLAREALRTGSLAYLLAPPDSSTDNTLDDERDALMIRVTGQGLQEAHAQMLRRLTTGETTPQMLVLIDNFHERVVRRHKPRDASADALEAWESEVAARAAFLKTTGQLLRRGNAAGVRVIAATATPYARSRVVTDLIEMMPGRILLTADCIPSIGTALIVFGEERGEEAWEMLERNGAAPGTGVALTHGRLIAWGHTVWGSTVKYSGTSIATYARQMTIASPTPADLVILSLVYLLIVGTGISESAASAGVSRDQVKLLDFASQGQPLHRIAASMVIPRGLAEAIPGPDVVESYAGDLGALSIRLDRPLTDATRLSLVVLGVHAFGVPLIEAVALVETEADAILQNMLGRPLVREWMRIANLAVGDD